MQVSKICVIGAGTMGAGIAAHFANLGFFVKLLDKDLTLARLGLERLKNTHPPHLYTQESLLFIEIGSIQENLNALREMDWVCEAIVEKECLKKELYKIIEPYISEDAWITTNTSSLEIHKLAQGRSKSFQERFLGTHFFNPPRYLKLVELIPGRETNPEVTAGFVKFLEERAAKRVVLAKDTPGFIANRFGMWSMFHAVHIAEDLGMSVEEVDQLTGPFLGRPRTASFRLSDLVGLDIMQDIAESIYERCPNDPYKETLLLPKSVKFLIEKGWIGAKVGRGYYFKHNHEAEVLDLAGLTYRGVHSIESPSLSQYMKMGLFERIQEVLQENEKESQFIRQYLFPVLKYADYLRNEISYSVQDFDRVMQWGFGWKKGPFEMMDGLDIPGLKQFSVPFYMDHTMLDLEGVYIPIKKEPEYQGYADFRLVKEQDSFRIRDLEEGVMGIGMTFKMGILNPERVKVLSELIAAIDGSVVLYSEEGAFSAGFDLSFFLKQATKKRKDVIDEALKDLQNLTLLLSQKRVVAAVHGFCIGAGLEIASACPMMVVNIESKLGFPESKVGLLPAGAGTSRMHLWHQDSSEALINLVKQLTLGSVSQNAKDALMMGYLRSSDQIVYHPDRLLTNAKAHALNVKPASLPVWEKPHKERVLEFESALTELVGKGDLTAYDQEIGKAILEILRMANSLEDALGRERKHFIKLLGHKQTLNRIDHMLKTGRPLKN